MFWMKIPISEFYSELLLKISAYTIKPSPGGSPGDEFFMLFSEGAVNFYQNTTVIRRHLFANYDIKRTRYDVSIVKIYFFCMMVASQSA